MNDVAGVATPITITKTSAAEKHNSPKIIAIDLESEPDSYTPKAKISAQGYAAAGIGAIGIGHTIYQASKLGLEKFINGAEKEIGTYMKELGKNFTGIPTKIKVNAKYGAALAAAVGVTAMVFKDSDKDGKLDILEAAQKFLTPDE